MKCWEMRIAYKKKGRPFKDTDLTYCFLGCMENNLTMKLERMLCGVGKLAKGTLQACSYEQATDRFALSFSTATSPSQIYTIEVDERQSVRQHTRERVVGLPKEWLSAGEDASFTSLDGLRISARLYLPTPALGMEGPHPLVYYIHGGPEARSDPTSPGSRYR